MSETEFSKDLTTLNENKQVAKLASGQKTAYIRDKVFEFGPLFWDKLREAMTSDDKDERRMAMIEYNKLQARVLPTEISGADGEQLVLNVVQWTKPKEDNE